jgi:hypothetical protein
VFNGIYFNGCGVCNNNLCIGENSQRKREWNKNFFMSSGFHYTKFLTKILNIIL